MTTRAINRCALIAGLALAALPVSGGAADAMLEFLEARVQEDPLDFTAQNRLADRYIKLMRETGDLATLDRAASAARASLSAVPAEQNPGGLAALAIVEFESHHFADALKLAGRSYDIDPRNFSALATIGDAQLELGNYTEAGTVYAKLAEDSAAPPILARQAKLAELKGHNQQAIELLTRAIDAEAGPGVWFHVRLGELYFRTGGLKQAEAQYQAALGQMPENFLALEHLAELRAAQSRYEEAVLLYQKVIARVPRAEFFQALGDLYRFMDKPDDAKPWHERALAAYRKSIEQGNAHYLHHLAVFYCDVQENPAEALRWAQKDLKVRHSLYAYDSLAWALYKNGDYSGARDAMDKALIPGTQDAHLFYHAGLIYSLAGDLQQGQTYLKQAVAINPVYNAFHAHR
ncbi:MAG: tetratricopeptide repeat protein [Methylococcales bacterium]